MLMMTVSMLRYVRLKGDHVNNKNLLAVKFTFSIKMLTHNFAKEAQATLTSHYKDMYLN